jgi:hypothetical protein
MIEPAERLKAEQKKVDALIAGLPFHERINIMTAL